MKASMQSVNPRFSGEGSPDVEAQAAKSPPGMSTQVAVNAVPDNHKNTLKGLAVVAAIVVGVMIVLATTDNTEEAVMTQAPKPSATAAPTTMLRATGAPTMSETIITFSPNSTVVSDVSAPYTAAAAVNLFSIPALGRFVTLDIESGNLENGFDVLEVWNSADVGVEGKMPLQSLTGIGLQSYPDITTTVRGGMTLKMMTDDDIVPEGDDAGFVARASIFDTMAPTRAPTGEPVPELVSVSYTGALGEFKYFTDDGIPFANETYGNYMLKEYLFEAPDADYAVMQFREFDVRSYPEGRDHVQVFDGAEGGALLGYFNGDNYKFAQLRSPSNKFRFLFTVGGRGGYGGFEILCVGFASSTPSPTTTTKSPTLSGPPPIPPITLALGEEFTHDGSNATSVGPTGNKYENNFLRQWQVDAGADNHVVLDFNFFNTEANYDYVTVWDQDDPTKTELLKVAGKFEDGLSITIPAQKVVIQFKSDGGVTEFGFVGTASATLAVRCELLFATATDSATSMKTKVLASTYLGVIENEAAEFSAVMGVIGEFGSQNTYGFPQGTATLTKDNDAGTVTFVAALDASTDGFTYTIAETGLAATTDEVFMIDGLSPLYGGLYTKSETAQVTAAINVIKAGTIDAACVGTACEVTPSIVAFAKVCTDYTKPLANGPVIDPVAVEAFTVSDEPFIKVVYTNPETKQVVRDAFDAAAAKWNSVIKNNFPDIPLPASITSGADLGCDSALTVDLPDTTMLKGLVIYASIKYLDGPGRILGSAGPCAFSLESGFYFGQGSKVQPRVGAMNFDESDLGSMYMDGSLNGVIAHEMGHVLGVGTTWQSWAYDLLDMPRSSITPQQDPRYMGPKGIEGFVDIGGTAGDTTIGGGDVPKKGVPIARTGGGGTSGSHWRETQFASELMSGYAAPGNKYELSKMTAKSLMDVGYTNIDLSGTDEYVIPSEFTNTETLANARSMGNDIMTFKKIGLLSANGDVSTADTN